jgi:predicted nucleic acid-binding protein
VIFWDTSAWVRRYEKGDPCQERAQNLFDRAARQFGSELLPIEVLSAAVRTRRLRAAGLAPVLKAIRAETAILNLVSISESLGEAERIVVRRGLRAADAITVAGAVLACRRIARMPLVTADDEQAAAARAEGLRVIRLA